MAKTIFLLGAGASRDAGLPLMPELTEKFGPWLAQREGVENKNQLKLLFERSVTTVSAGGVPNIEFVLRLLTDVDLFKRDAHAKTVASWAHPFDTDKAVVTNLTDLIREYIRETLLRAPASSGDYLSGLLDFKDEENPVVEVFTLNYDRLVESMAARGGHRFTSGFGEAWDPSLFDLETWALRIYKLHGSVDWYRLAKGNVIYRGSPEHPAFPGEAVEEVLLYPARAKAAHADPFATLISRFNRELGSAQYCVAVGYSFQDEHIRRTVLDRMVTNRSLQLLIVDPRAGEVLESILQSADGPQFALLRDRLAGLRMPAKEAFDNREIFQRLRDIEDADRQLESVWKRRNVAMFDDAAHILFAAIEFCRLRAMQYKPVRFLHPGGITDFDAALARVIARRFSPSLSLTPFESSATSNIIEVVSQLVALWALAEALRMPEAAGMQKEIGEVLRQYASNVIFALDGEYRVWQGGLAMADADLIKKRGADLTALVSELTLHPPMSAFAVGNTDIKEAYDALKDAFEILAGFYRTFALQPVVRKQIPFRGREVIVPGHQRAFDSLNEISARFLRSKALPLWAPDPVLRGPVAELATFGLPA